MRERLDLPGPVPRGHRRRRRRGDGRAIPVAKARRRSTAPMAAVQRIAGRLPDGGRLVGPPGGHRRDPRLRSDWPTRSTRRRLVRRGRAAASPQPDVYRLAAERLGVDPADCLVVEDSLNGILAGRAAGHGRRPRPERVGPAGAGAREAATLILDRLDRSTRPARESPGPVLPAATVPGACGTRRVEADAPTCPARRSIRCGGPFEPAPPGLFAGSSSGSCSGSASRDASAYPAGPAVLCFNHQSWIDPFVLWPPCRGGRDSPSSDPGRRTCRSAARNRIDELDRHRGPVQAGQERPPRARRAGSRRVLRRRAASWPSPGRGGSTPARGRSSRSTTGRRSSRCGRGVPIVPVAVNGTCWLAFGRTIRVRIGEPIAVEGRPTRAGRRRPHRPDLGRPPRPGPAIPTRPRPPGASGRASPSSSTTGPRAPARGSRTRDGSSLGPTRAGLRDGRPPRRRHGPMAGRRVRG